MAGRWPGLITTSKPLLLIASSLRRDGWCEPIVIAGLSSTPPHRKERNKPATPQYLEVLGLERGANPAAIDGAYRRLAMKYHPDHGGDVEEFKRLQEAYETAMGSVL